MTKFTTTTNQQDVKLFDRIIEFVRSSDVLLYGWIIVILIVSLITSFIIPIYITFTDSAWTPTTLVYLAYFVPIIYAIDFIISLVGALYLWRKNKINLVERSRVIVKLIFQALPMFPYLLLELYIIKMWSGSEGVVANAVEWFYFLPILYMFKIIGIRSYFNHVENNFYLNPNLRRLIFFAVFLTLLSHWIACGWVILHSNFAVLPAGSVSATYLNGLYWSVTTLTTVGYGDITPINQIEKIYTMIVMMSGVGVYGYVIGNVANLLNNLDIAKANFNSKMVERIAFLNGNQVPAKLKKQILAYYLHQWNEEHMEDEIKIFKELPDNLRHKLMFFLNESFLQQVPFFYQESPEVLASIIQKLALKHYMEDDFIVKKGEQGDRMFFIVRGNVAILDEQGSETLFMLGEGQFFGEIALVENRPRANSIKALNFCHLYVLFKKDFLNLQQQHPEFKKHILEIIKQRKEANTNKVS